MSASSRPTFAPSRLSDTARLLATVLLPTPPLPLITSTTLFTSGTGSSAATSRGGKSNDTAHRVGPGRRFVNAAPAGNLTKRDRRAPGGKRAGCVARSAARTSSLEAAGERRRELALRGEVRRRFRGHVTEHADGFAE